MPMQNKYQKTEEINLQILRVLAYNGQYSQYDLPKVVKKSYRTVLRRLLDLEHNCFITLANKPLGAKDKKIYKLTYLGLVKYLGSLDDAPKDEDFDIIAKKNKDLLVFFNDECWQYFKDVAIYLFGASKELFMRLPSLLERTTLRFFEWSQNWSRHAVEKKIVAELVTEFFPVLSSESLEDLLYYLQGFKASKLRWYIDRVYDERSKELTKRLKELKTWGKEWETIKKTIQKKDTSNAMPNMVDDSANKNKEALVEWRKLVRAYYN